MRYSSFFLETKICDSRPFFSSIVGTIDYESSKIIKISILIVMNQGCAKSALRAAFFKSVSRSAINKKNERERNCETFFRSFSAQSVISNLWSAIQKRGIQKGIFWSLLKYDRREFSYLALFVSLLSSFFTCNTHITKFW